MPQCVATFAFDVRTNTAKSTFLGSDGIIKTREVAVVSEEASLQLEVQDVDYVAMQTALGEMAEFVENREEIEEINLCPVVSTGYPSSLFTNQTSAWAYDNTDRVIMTKVLGAPASKYEYQVDTVLKQVNFHPDLIGNVVSLLVRRTPLSRGTIGKQDNFLIIQRYSFQGELITTSPDGPYILDIPYMEKKDLPTIAADGSSLRMSFCAVHGGDAQNDRKPWRFITKNSLHGRNL